jgi:methionyl-tRNA synthetase
MENSIRLYRTCEEESSPILAEICNTCNIIESEMNDGDRCEKCGVTAVHDVLSIN